MTRNRPRMVACGAAALLVGLALAGCRSDDATPQSTVPQASSSSAIGGEPTMDAVASELDQINQLINDINNAVQPTDTSPDGGE